MITDKDRSGWFGASDVSQIMSKWESDTFKKWWLEKLGLRKNDFESKAMRAGTVFEHRILNTIPNVIKDRQILIPELSLRVNLDGETDIIHEVKTHGIENEYKPTLSHTRQVNIQMYATGKAGEIISYGLTPGDYKNYFAEIDIDRIKRHPIEYDEKFIAEFIDRVKILKDYMDKGAMPERRGK